ncbi:MAG: hypothetical protein R2941_04520 [Desulfobacterales bacterium]
MRDIQIIKPANKYTKYKKSMLSFLAWKKQIPENSDLKYKSIAKKKQIIQLRKSGKSNKRNFSNSRHSPLPMFARYTAVKGWFENTESSSGAETGTCRTLDPLQENQLKES